MTIPWDDEQVPTRKEVAEFLHGRVWQEMPLHVIRDGEGDDFTDEAITSAIRSVLRGLADVIYQQRRNYPLNPDPFNPPQPNLFYDAATANVDTLLDEIGDALDDLL